LAEQRRLEHSKKILSIFRGIGYGVGYGVLGALIGIIPGCLGGGCYGVIKYDKFWESAGKGVGYVGIMGLIIGFIVGWRKGSEK